MLCYRKYTLSRIKFGVILSENSVYGAKTTGFRSAGLVVDLEAHAVKTAIEVEGIDIGHA